MNENQTTADGQTPPKDPGHERPYWECIKLAWKLNTDPELYKEFLAAMSGSPEKFETWLTEHKVPAEKAKKIAEEKGDELAKIVGHMVCKNLW